MLCRQIFRSLNQICNFFPFETDKGTLFSFSFLRSVLSQAKQKTLLILPGFEAVDTPDDFSGQYTVRIVFLTIM